MKHIEEKLDKILEILEEMPRKKLKLAKDVVVDNKELMRQRKEELIKIFWSLVALPLEKKEKQSFPREIRQGSPYKDKISGKMLAAEIPEIVPYSVLKNRCLLRSVFRLREGENSEAVLNAVISATATLETLTLGETSLREGSGVRCVWSKTELHRRKLTIPIEAAPKRESFVKPVYVKSGKKTVVTGGFRPQSEVDAERWGAKFDFDSADEDEPEKKPTGPIFRDELPKKDVVEESEDDVEIKL